MPRKSKGARLHERKRNDGATVYEIRDTGDVRISTGTNCREDAEKQLAEYISRKNRPSGPVGPQELSVSMCLSVYAEEHAAHVKDPARIGYAIEALDAFWRELPVSDITGATCRRYAASRINKKTGLPVSPGTTRRELGVLAAALEHCAREGYLTAAPKVTKPAKPNAKERWLTRQEAAWLMRGARSLNRDGRHLADFILHGLYTGSRKQTILAMHIDIASMDGGHVDTRNGILYRSPIGDVETNKRRRPTRIPPKYLAHLRRMAANGRLYVVERKMKIDGEDVRLRVGDIKTAWNRARELGQKLAQKHGIEIDLSDVTPHTLKHTAITWSLQNGASIWDAAGYFSTSAATIEKHYGHHSPDHQESAVRAMNKRPSAG